MIHDAETQGSRCRAIGGSSFGLSEGLTGRGGREDEFVGEEEYTGLNPWHAAVRQGLGLTCRRCRDYYQGEEEWRRDVLSFDPTAGSC
jgi:hypothetical protein